MIWQNKQSNNVQFYTDFSVNIDFEQMEDKSGRVAFPLSFLSGGKWENFFSLSCTM